MAGTPDLTLEQVLRCRAEAAFRCWTSPELLRRLLGSEQAPVIEAVLEPVVGGRLLVRQLCEGLPQTMVEGCILHFVPGRRLVWTDMLSAGWRPRAAGSFTADLSFTPTDRGHCDFRIILRHAADSPPKRERLQRIETRWRELTERLWRLAAEL